MSDPTDFSFFENAMAQQQQMQRQNPDRNLNLRFFSEAIENKAKSLEAGRPIHDQIDFVEINVAGSRDTVVEKMGAAQRQRFAAQYEMWKKTQAQPVDGTDLAVVPFLNIAQIKDFKASNVMTLEQLAGLSDTNVQKLGMGAVEARKKAQAYMKAAGDSAFSQRLVTENETLKRDLVATKQQVAELANRLEAALTGSPINHQAPDIAALVREEIRKAMQS